MKLHELVKDGVIKAVFQANYNGWTIDIDSAQVTEAVADKISEALAGVTHDHCSEDGGYMGSLPFSINVTARLVSEVQKWLPDVVGIDVEVDESSS